MEKMETEFIEAVRCDLYAELQHLVNVVLSGLLRQENSEKDLIHNLIMLGREICADWVSGGGPHVDRAKEKVVFLLFSVYYIYFIYIFFFLQLFMIRIMLEKLIAHASKGKRIMRKNIHGAHFMIIDRFRVKMFFLSCLLNFNGKYLNLEIYSCFNVLFIEALKQSSNLTGDDSRTGDLGN
jgi:hypothetical protein